MKKSEVRAIRLDYEQQLSRLVSQLAEERGAVRALRAEVADLRNNWRPVPMVHEWQPRDPQCALCDDPRDSARHRTE